MRADQLPYLLAFNSIPKLRFAEISRILAFFAGDAAEAWRAAPQWAGLAPHHKGVDAEICALHDRISPERLYAAFLESGFSVVCWEDGDYPARLRNIYDPPLLLFYLGHLPREETPAVAIVGARRATPYGRDVATIFARDLASQGALVASGMARGVDTAAHKGVLAAGGETIAVLGSGLDVVYPQENAKLYAQIVEKGCVMSEFPLGTEPLMLNFPRRNRIISGLADCLLVVEAGEKSGSLHTVDFALEQGKEVLAVPGPITSACSRGSNRLLQSGAAGLALSAADVWERLSSLPFQPWRGVEKHAAPATSEEASLLQFLATPRQFDEIAAATELDAHTLNTKLSLLEIKKQIRRLPGKYYQTIIKTILA